MFLLFKDFMIVFPYVYMSVGRSHSITVSRYTSTLVNDTTPSGITLRTSEEGYPNLSYSLLFLPVKPTISRKDFFNINNRYLIPYTYGVYGPCGMITQVKGLSRIIIVNY